MAKRKKLSKGAVRMTELGYHQVQVWLDPTIYEIAKAKANSSNQGLATWVRWLVEEALRFRPKERNGA